MADESHFSLLKQGANAWNEWRHEHRRDQADLSQADLHGVNLSKADLNWTNLSKAILSEADLRRANLYKANLSGADLRRSNLSGADLCGADLGRADLSGADFSKANLSRADLSMAYLTGATLRNACLDGANFERVTVSHTIFASVDLSSCTGVDSANHLGPSTLGVDSIILSKGRIPDIFLRGVGLPDEWIDYIPSLVWDGIQFFSCFISYSSADKPFADRLYGALQSKGIRCWLDEKQLLPGHDISRELERGIYLWDKFLLCASKNSLTSSWVEDEIKTTLEKERALRKERGKPVLKLIPLNLDGYMFSPEWDLGVLANEIRSRVAADFRDWEKPSSNFAQQVDLVIKALRADEGAREKPPPSRL
jgi:TIR domain/Pentapeptide repeats (8 copies)